ncbi:uncharacterized protein LOC135703544 [Ochlerotatus camptorhynchus]|uniref:uncharacterized protein LOC135703544 n=1 Tax=Ochlerotatus camptorhynchus TaxID=644619 RepID=UPI0031E0565F
MNKWFLMGCALVAVVGFASGDLGLTITIQGLSSNVRRSIGSGVKPVISANSSITVNATLDSSGTIIMLRSIVADVVNPMGTLLEAIENSTTDKSGDPTAVTASIDSLVTSSVMAIGNAIKTIGGSQIALDPEDYTVLNGNMTQLSEEVNSLTNVLSSLGNVLDQVNTANPPYTGWNVSTIITPALISTYTTPLKNISSTLSTLGSLISIIGKEKQFIIQRAVNLNDSIDSSLKSLVQVTTNFNRSSYDVLSNVASASVNSLKSINQSYAGILAKAASINNGNVTSLTNFLANTSTIAAVALSNIENNTASVTLNLAYVLANQTTNASLALYNGLKNITDMAFTSSSEFSMACERKYGAMLLQPGVSLTRLNLCLQAEIIRLTNFGQFGVSGFFSDVLKWVGLPAVRLNTCSVPNGTCIATAFNAFSDFSSRLEVKYNLISDQVMIEQTQVLDRATGCVNIVSSDLQDVVHSIQNKFVTCLTTGN